MENSNKNNIFQTLIIVFVIAILIVGGIIGYKELTKGQNNHDNQEEKTETENEITNPTEETTDITPLLYEVTRSNSANKMYLFGSIHAANNNDLNFPKYITDAYNNSHYLACEYDTVAYQNDTANVIKNSLKMMYQDGTTIKNHLNEKTYNKLIDFLTKKKQYVNTYEQYKLYFFISLISNIQANDANIDINSSIDAYFLKKAHNDKKNILEVESYDYQMNIFEELSDEIYDLLINNTIDNYEISITNLKNLYAAWKTGNVSDIFKYSSDDTQLKESYTQEQMKLVNDYNKKLVENRNDEMLKKAISYFNNNQDVFFMVGALHIVGDTGLANQLKQNGFTVKQISPQ